MDLPQVLAQTSMSPGGDVFDRLLKERIVFLNGSVDDNSAIQVTAKLLLLDAEDPDGDIYLYINSPGGSVYAGMAIYDTMQFVRPDVSTICMGMAASMGQFLLCAGAKGKRYSLPHSTIHFHPAGGGMEGYAPDVERMVNELLRLQHLGSSLLAKATGRSIEEIEQDFSRDRFMTPEQAKDYGFIDEILNESSGAVGL